MKPQGPWTEILKQGILMERQAELITDALRALLLQKWGYKTKVFEFISTQHTPKNVMIAAVKSNAKMNEGANQIEKDIQGLKDTFGISEHYLEKLLKG
jgi:adenylosuccinate lyase